MRTLIAEAQQLGAGETVFTATIDAQSGLPQLICLTSGGGKIIVQNQARLRTIASDLEGCGIHLGGGRRESRTYTGDWHELKEQFLATEALMDATIDDDWQMANAALFRLFRLSASYRANPCSLELFTALNDERLSSRHAAGISIEQYYDWYVRSALRLDAAGELTDSARSEAAEQLAKLANSSAQRLFWQLIRTLRVHPRHHAAYLKLIDGLEETP